MKIIITFVLIIYSISVFAEEAAKSYKDEEGEVVSTYLKSHEPNILGIAYDDDDEDTYLDFKISLQYPLFKKTFDKLSKKKGTQDNSWSVCNNDILDQCHPYIAFTGRFAQYIDVGDYGRDSSPVVSRRFNPKLFFRFEKNKHYYLDVEYGHESNGQSISDKASYDAMAAELASRNKGDPSHANDYISRGWDYWGITAKYKPQDDGWDQWSFYLSLAKYLGGAFQGSIEEFYDDFEQPRDITKRQQVNGFRLMAKWKEEGNCVLWFVGCKVALIYETGLNDFAQYNTAQLELSTRILDVPVMLWFRNGYANNLAEYYKDVFSMGIALELRTFE